MFNFFKSKLKETIQNDLIETKIIISPERIHELKQSIREVLYDLPITTDVTPIADHEMELFVRLADDIRYEKTIEDMSKEVEQYRKKQAQEIINRLQR